MNLLINFSCLKEGGGHNVAMNFIYGVQSFNLKDIKIYYFVAKNSGPHLHLEKHGFNYYVVPENPLKEFYLSYLNQKKFLVHIILILFIPILVSVSLIKKFLK